MRLGNFFQIIFDKWIARDNMAKGHERVCSVSDLQFFIKYGFILKWLW